MAEGQNDEQLYAKLSYEIAVYREQLKLLEREIQRIQITNSDLTNAAETCLNLKASQTLVPIGGGAFLNANIQSTKILMPVGANYLLEMEGDKAILELHKRVDAARSATDKLRIEYQKIVQKLQEAHGHLQTLQSKLAISRRVDENIGEDYI